MKITFILGNGFDIQLGLKTGYRDFLNEYIKTDNVDSTVIHSFKEYLGEKDNLVLWSDIEQAMGVYLGKFSDSTVSDFEKQIEDLEKEIANYLLMQQEKCSYEQKDKIGKAFRNFLLNSFQDPLNRKQIDIEHITQINTYNFVTFNYTDTLERIKECCLDQNNSAMRHRSVNSYRYEDNWGKIIHVHGTLDSQIIMGVNDKSQLDATGGVTISDRIKWELIKPQQNRTSHHDWDTPAIEVIKNSDIIAIYGVSFGETDRLWWNILRDWLKATKSHKMVVFKRATTQPFSTRIPWAEINYEKEQCTDVLKKIGISEDDAQFNALLDQVYIVLNTSRLQLKELLQTDRALATSTA